MYVAQLKSHENIGSSTIHETMKRGKVMKNSKEIFEESKSMIDTQRLSTLNCPFLRRFVVSLSLLLTDVIERVNKECSECMNDSSPEYFQLVHSFTYTKRRKPK